MLTAEIDASEKRLKIVYRHSKYDPKEFLLEKDNSISFSEVHVFKVCGLLIIAATMPKYICRKREGEKLSYYSQGQLAQIERDLQKHKFKIP